MLQLLSHHVRPMPWLQTVRTPCAPNGCTALNTSQWMTLDRVVAACLMD